VAKSVINAERFAKGMTFDEYVRYAGSPEESRTRRPGVAISPMAVVGAPRKGQQRGARERYARARLSDHQTAAIKWLVAQPNGPAKILVISEDWSSDCRRDVPVIARLSEAGSMELRIFNRDGRKILASGAPIPPPRRRQHDLIARVHEQEERSRVGVCARGGVLCEGLPGAPPPHRVPGHLSQGPHPRTSAGGATRRERGAEEERDRREFLGPAGFAFFDVWACAGIDETLSALYERWCWRQLSETSILAQSHARARATSTAPHRVAADAGESSGS